MSCVHFKVKKIVILALVVLLMISMTNNDNRTVYNSNAKNQNKIALTFDDGPHPKITLKIFV